MIVQQLRSTQERDRTIHTDYFYTLGTADQEEIPNTSRLFLFNTITTKNPRVQTLKNLSKYVLILHNDSLFLRAILEGVVELQYQILLLNNSLS